MKVLVFKVKKTISIVWAASIAALLYLRFSHVSFPWLGGSAKASLLLGMWLCLLRMLQDLYGIAQRKTAWTRLLLPVLIALILAGSWHGGLGAGRMAWAIAAFEIVVIIWVVVTVLRSASRSRYFERDIESSISRFLPPVLSKTVAGELAVMVSAYQYVVSRFSKRARAGSDSEIFGYVEDASIRHLPLLIFLINVVDVIAFEIFLVTLSPIYNILFLILDVWALVWVIGLVGSMHLRPHVVSGETVTLNRGLLRRVVIPVEDIESVQIAPKADRSALNLSLKEPKLFSSSSGRSMRRKDYFLESPALRCTPQPMMQHHLFLCLA